LKINHLATLARKIKGFGTWVRCYDFNIISFKTFGGKIVFLNTPILQNYWIENR
jgi:hypothetical protein